MNNVCINGRLTGEPIFKNLGNDNAVATLFIANTVSSKKVNFLKATAWGKQAKIIAEHARKGMELFITGRLEQSSYINSKGDTVYDVSITVENFNFGKRPSGSITV